MNQTRGLPIAVATIVLTTAALLAQNVQQNPASGSLNGRQYINTYFGFSYSLPDSWSGTASQAVSNGQVFPLFSAGPPSTGEPDYRRIVVQAEYLGQNGAIKTGKDFLDTAIPLLTGPTSAFEALPGDVHYTFGGQGFDRMDLRSKQAPGRPQIYQAQVCTVLGDYVLIFQFIGTSHDDLEGLMPSMAFLHFAAPSATSPATPGFAANPSTSATPSALIGATSPPNAAARQNQASAALVPDSVTPAKPDATKAAMIQGVIPTPSATMSRAGGTTPPSTPVSKTVEIGKTSEVYAVVPASVLESHVIKKVPAIYPPAARQAHIEGLVELTIVVNEKGEVKEVTPVSGNDLLARSAEQSLRQWRFKPIFIDGKPARVESQVSLNFQLPR